MSSRFHPPGQCPACGEWVPRGAAACDDCGACAKSGWSGDLQADGLDLPEEDFNYDDFVAREFGDENSTPRKVGMSPLWWWVAVALLISLAAAALLPAFR